MKGKFLASCMRLILLLASSQTIVGTASADVANPLPNAGVSCADSDPWTYCNPISNITSLHGGGVVIVQVILGLLGTIALLALTIAGLTYVTSAGNEERIKKAKRVITNTVIGLGIALLAFSLLNTILAILG